jgi:hypothetical protein
VVFGVSPYSGALKAPVAFFASGVVSTYGPPDAVLHSKETVALGAVPRSVRLPFRVAEVVVMPVAASVVTNGSVAPAAVVEVNGIENIRSKSMHSEREKKRFLPTLHPLRVVLP